MAVIFFFLNVISCQFKERVNQPPVIIQYSPNLCLSEKEKQVTGRRILKELCLLFLREKAWVKNMGG